MANKALDEFGAMIMVRVRDQTILEWDEIVDGQRKGEAAEQVREILASMDENEISKIHALIPRIVDTVLFHFLFLFEEEENLRIGITLNGESTPDLRSVSDGLSGELYSRRGWIHRFSKMRYYR